MAVVFDAVGPSSAGTAVAGTSLTWSHTCSGSDRLLTVGVGLGGSDSGVTTTVTYNGVAMTSAGKVHANNQAQGYVELFYLAAPDTGANDVVVTASASRDIIGGSVSFTGVDQTNPVSGITTSFGDGTNASLTVPSASGNMVVAAVATGAWVEFVTQTSRWIKNFNGHTGASNAAQSTSAGATSVPMSFTVTSDWWGMIGLSVSAVPETTAPIAVTQAVTNIQPTTAMGNGIVMSDGGSTITERGVCWSTSPGPTTADNTATSAGTVGSFSASMTGLSDNTLYYVRAYAVNAIGTSYGDEVTFMNYQVKLSWVGA